MQATATCADTSTLLGAPPTSWRRREMDTMVQVHTCYRTALGSEKKPNGQAVMNDKSMLKCDTTVEGSDEPQNDYQSKPGNHAASGPSSRENFLPMDSVLRSLDGYGRQPANCPFIDDRAFRSSIDTTYWRDYFVRDSESHDPFLNEMSQTCIAHICNAQANGLIARNGSIPLGSLLRKKRSHIVPVSLVFHEIKLWLVTEFRTFSVFEATTFTSIAARIRYLEMLQQPKVWGSVKYFPRSGMRSDAHDNLFRTMLTLKEDLKKAHDYSYRGYCRRTSREKLDKLNNLLKSVVFAAIRLISGLFETSVRLSDPAHNPLQPMDLLSTWANQRFVNYDNFTHVLLYAIMQMPLFKASVLGDYDSVVDSDESRDGPQAALALDPESLKASNKLRIPVFSSKSGELRIPAAYDTVSEAIRQGLAKGDPHHKPPPKGSQVRKNLLAAFGGQVDDAQRMVDGLANCLSALQDLAPCMFVVFQLWEMAGQGGDFILFDTLRTNTIEVMKTTESRIDILSNHVSSLLQAAELLKIAQQERSERERLVKKRAMSEPAWTANVRTVQHEQAGVFRRVTDQCKLQLHEISKDAHDYSLTAEQLNARVQKLKKLCEALVDAPTNSGITLQQNPQQA